MGATAVRPRDGALSRRRGTAVLLLIIAAVLAVAAAGFLAYRATHLVDPPFWPFADAQPVPSEQDRSDATAAAEQFALRVDGFRAADSKGYLASVTPLLTTRFKAEFSKVIEATADLQEATGGDVVGEGTVLASGVAGIDADTAQVLVIHDNTVTAGQDVQQNHHRWVVDLRKVSGSWLVDGFDAVS